MRVLGSALVCVVLTGLVIGQSSSPAPALKQRPSAPAAEPGTSKAATPKESSTLAPDAPVITVQGLCEKPAGSSATPSDCKTVVTKAEFERVVPPTAPVVQKKGIATQYVQALVLAEKAHESGLDHTPEFEQQLSIIRLKILASMAYQDLQKQTKDIPESEIEDYYKQHIGDFKAVSFDRLYVPKQKTMTASTQKPNDPDLQKKREASEAEMKEEAEKLRARAATGEDFTKLQQEAYDFAGLKQTAQYSRMNDIRKNGSFPVSLFEMKAGEVSQVSTEPAGFMVYKIAENKDLPLANVHEEVAGTLRQQKFKSAVDALQNSVKTTLEDSYFATPSAPTLRNPGEPAAQTPPPPGKK